MIPGTTSSFVELALDEPAAVQDKKLKKSPKQINSWTPQVLEVFKHWQEVLNHKNAKLDAERRNCIVSVLEMGFSVDELKIAIQGVKNTPHNMGDNPNGKKYDQIHLIFRNSRQVERFISNFDTREAPIRENVATGVKLSFTERNQATIKHMNTIGEKMRQQMLANIAARIPQSEDARQLTQVKEL